MRYAIDALFPFVATRSDLSPGCVKRCPLTGIMVVYSEIVKKAYFDNENGAWGRLSQQDSGHVLRSAVVSLRRHLRRTTHLLYSR